MHPRSLLPARQQGFTLLALLFAVALLGVGMAAVGTMWHTAAQRDKEAQLLFAGDQYRRAIEGFVQRSPGNEKRLPKSLDELLLDPRFPNTVRHLRRLYPDPFTGQAEWGLMQGEGGGIIGVRSLSDAVPLKTAGFASGYEAFQGAARVGDWVFQARLGGAAAVGGTAGAATSGQGDALGEAAAGQGGGPGTGATDAAPSSPASPPGQDAGATSELSRAVRLAACHAARLQGNLACGAELAQGGQAAWLPCMDKVAQSFQACTAAR